MKKIFRTLFIFILLALCFSVRASVELQSQRLTTRDGLANNSVRHIYQDSKGFIWMGTLNGLNRYDGNSFITFLPQGDNEISLADHRIRSLTEDKNGFLWISTSADLFSCYDLQKDCFVDFTGCGEYMDHYGYISNFPDEIWLWGRNQGCRRIIYENGIFTSESFNLKNGTLSTNHIQFLQQDSNGTIWVGTQKGLYFWNGYELICIQEIYLQWMCELDRTPFFLTTDGDIWTCNEKKEPAKVATVPDIQSGLDLPGEFVLEGQWIIFTSKGGFIFDPDTYAIKQAPPALNIPHGETIKDNRDNFWVYNKTGKLYYIDVQTSEVVSLQLLPQEKVGFIDSERYHIVHDSRDMIWISTYGNGLFMYEPLTDNLQQFKSESNGLVQIGSNFLQYIMQDRSGSIWVSSEYAGISLLRVVNDGATRFYPEKTRNDDEYLNRIRMLTSTANGDIWLGTRNGSVYVYDSELCVQKEKINYTTNIYAVVEDATGTKWYGSRGNGLYIGNKNYMYNVNDPASLGSNEIFCLFRDSKNRMWIGTFGGGLNLAIPDPEKGYTFRRFFNQTYGQRRVRSIYEDQNGYLWIGTNEGVFIFNPEQLIENPDKYYSYNSGTHHLSSNEIRSICQDSKGNIWVAESGTGFSVCTPGTDYNNLKFEHYGVEDGLTNSIVQAFVEDSEGKMWISTEYGISCFDPVTKTFENYFFSDKILDNVYGENCALLLQNGDLIFGTNYGLVIIDPEQMERASYELVVTFTDLKLNGISVRENPDSPLKNSLAYTDAIYLKYDQNSLIFDFSTLDYSNSISPKFSYKLENYDKEWSIPSTLNFAAYKNLKPGTYNLYVKACNAAGVWGSREAMMKIVISPPFWKTSWAYILYMLFILATVYISFRVIRNINQLRNKIKIEEELTEYKLVFFTNISHEFRTPLTLIRGALEKIHQQKAPKDMLYSIKLMDKSTQRMLRLINQLLEFRKMQNDKLALSLEETDVIAFLYEIYLSFKDTAESKNMDFRFISSVPSYKMFIDKSNLDKVAYNLLSNAFKYTPSGGKVEFNIQVDENTHQLIIKVTDSGIGIPKEKQGELFKRFMQSSFSNNSMGVGLHLTHELVNVHKGNINYHDNPDGGSIFTVVLSTDSSVYEKKDFLIPSTILLQEEEMTAKRLVDFTFEEDTDENEKDETENKASPSVPLNKRKILIIEDDNDVRDFLKKELSTYFEVVAESDGDAGFERACTYDADLIISDVVMPGYSGFELTKKLKDNFETSHIPIILLTALNASESHLEGIESGADAYITKPFSTKLLLTRVFKLIEQREKLREKFSNDLSIVRPTICTNDKDKEFMDKLTQIIEEQLENPEFNMDDFASMMALGRTVFYRKVQGVTGYTPKEYVRIMRMKKAAELLISTDDTVAEVAYKVGINDPFYFSKCFKSQFGVAPSVYQKNAKNAQENKNPES